LIVLPRPDRLEELLAEIRACGGTLISVTPHKGSLEELFFTSQGREAGVERGKSV